MLRICKNPYCRREFETGVHATYYCSLECRETARKARLPEVVRAKKAVRIIQCPVCLKYFETTSVRSTKMYCSSRCSHAAHESGFAPRKITELTLHDPWKTGALLPDITENSLAVMP